MVRGRRTRASTAAIAMISPKPEKTQSKLSTKRDYKPLHKTNTTFGDLSGISPDSIGIITRRTRHLRKSLQNIQKQFDNQAITNFFQVQVKSNQRSFADNDENACDAFGVLDLSKKSDVNHNERDNDGDDDDQNSKGSSHSASSHNSIQPSNIFLQKPVLHLKIDKSLKQTKSIVINKQLDVCPNFATPFSIFNNSIACNSFSNALNTAKIEHNNQENGQFGCLDATIKENPLRSGKRENADNNGQSERRKLKRKHASRSSDTGLSDALNNSESNSCDSGVVADKSLELSQRDDNKPIIPHRIVCPSHVAPVAQAKKPPQQLNAAPKKTITNARTRRMHSQRRLRTDDAESLLEALASVQNSATDSQIESSDTSENEHVIKEEKEEEISYADMTVKTEKVNEIATSAQQTVDTTTIKSSVSRSSTPVSTKLQSKQMTDYFPVRRSIRKTKRTVEQEYLRHIEIAIEKQSEDGLIVKLFKDKGRGICASRPFQRSEFVVEYIGDLIDQIEADRREEIYAKDCSLGCYMYYFKHKEQQWCIDATAESGKLGRLVNHSRNGNLVTKIVTYKNRPHLVLIAKEDIKEGEELTYDYGDRTRESLVNHPWLAL